MSRIYSALVSVLFCCAVLGQQQAEVKKTIKLSVSTIATEIRLSGARAHLDAATEQVLLFGPAHNKVAGDKFEGFEFPSFHQTASLKDLGRFAAPAASAEAAKTPSGRSYGNLVFESAAPRLHYFGGFQPTLMDEHWIFDLKAKSWALAEPKAGPRPGQRDACASFLDAEGKSFFLYGGLKTKGPMTELWRYDFESADWAEIKAKEGQTWPSARLTAPGAQLGDGRGVVVGGLDVNFGALADVWAFNSNDLSWEQLADLPEGLSGTAALWHPKLQRLLAIGGSRAAAAQTAIYAYDPQLNSWQKVGDLQQAIAHAAAVYDAKNDRVLVFGGTTGMFLAGHPDTMIQVLTAAK